ncbi:hypothetical protein GCM10007079_03880 [Nocardiopsis terrae]|uniref:Uncharacterized protein n=1 Tax=Nocardiopsis terrae TaxID=372655 RepID=A0ABR9HN80_9ACTN|nr:hypothetical protein [Nocardiopsis terrae]MBE1460439.1 hypothetical protein [Nocardiopsis terrae]GHC71476.1 hypothetical protein GCM10007079_03880 [Nocardiopsis terrae]
MGVATKLGLYAVGLVVVFAAAFGAGSLAGPVLPEWPEGHSEGTELPAEGEQDHDGGDSAEH